MQKGMFLGYKVNTDGLKVCLKKADMVLSLPSPRYLKDVQKLNGKLASLNRFLLKSAEKSLPFFKTLKKCTKKSDFQWTQEAEAAFKQMKKLIAELSMLTAPKEKEELIVYLAAAKEAISAVLMTDREGKQVPVYFVSRKILADFIVERPEEESLDELMTKPEELLEPWTLFTDGSSCVDGSGAGLILTNAEGAEFTYAMRFRFEATNNEAEYEALIAGLRIAEQMGVKNLQAHVDSRLVANQVNGSYVAKESGMIQYLNKVKTLARSFREFSIKQVPRSENKKADALSKIASTSFAHLSKQVLVEELKEKSINEKEILAVVEEEGNTWMTPICEYLTKEILPADKKKARAVRRKAARFGLPGEIHLQINGLVEREKRSLGEGIKARLDERSKDWIGELSHVLWSHHIMIKSSNRETPFSLTYGTEAVIPAEIGMPMLWTMEVDPTKNDEALEINLDLIEEKGNKQQFKKQKAKLKWKSITTSGSAVQISSHATWSTAATTQVTPGMEGNLDPNGKDRTKLQNRLEKEHTNLKIIKEMNSRGHGTFVILKSVIYTKCKDPPGTYDASEGNISIYLYLVIY
ncbi:reverse transcriptase domain-containing protein [Tanacetum coccineum]